MELGYWGEWEERGWEGEWGGVSPKPVIMRPSMRLRAWWMKCAAVSRPPHAVMGRIDNGPAQALHLCSTETNVEGL